MLALAPDARSVAPARRTARPAFWPERGRSEGALWGTCEGADTYEVWVDLRAPAWRCTCPGRRPPCRHVLALLLMAGETPEAVPAAEPPPALQAWLGRRPARPEAAPRDPAAAARRAAAHEAKVDEGLAALKVWLTDRVRLGLPALAGLPPEAWRDMAARMEDARAKALPERLLRLAERVGAGPDWPGEVLDELGRLALLIEARAARARLPAPLQAELKTRLGWPQRERDALAEGEAVEDRWLVLGQRHDDMRWTAGLTATRTWLRGERSGRWAMLLRYEHAAARGRPGDDPPPAPGLAFEGALHFAPAGHPQRAFPRLPPQTEPMEGPPAPDVQEHEQLLTFFAQALAASPWTERVPALMGGMIPALDQGRWWLLDRRGLALPLPQRPPWALLAASGGHPVDLVVEWDGRRITPLSLVGPEGLTPLEGP